MEVNWAFEIFRFQLFLVAQALAGWISASLAIADNEE
jgi:hypothetical protein